MSRAEIENRLKHLMGDVIEGEITDESEEDLTDTSVVDLVEQDCQDNPEHN